MAHRTPVAVSPAQRIDALRAQSSNDSITQGGEFADLGIITQRWLLPLPGGPVIWPDVESPDEAVAAHAIEECGASVLVAHARKVRQVDDRPFPQLWPTANVRQRAKKQSATLARLRNDCHSAVARRKASDRGARERLAELFKREPLPIAQALDR